MEINKIIALLLFLLGVISLAIIFSLTVGRKLKIKEVKTPKVNEKAFRKSEGESIRTRINRKDIDNMDKENLTRMINNEEDNKTEVLSEDELIEEFSEIEDIRILSGTFDDSEIEEAKKPEKKETKVLQKKKATIGLEDMFKEEADINKTYFNGIKFNEKVFDYDLKGNIYENCEFISCKFIELNLDNVIFKSSKITNSSFTGSSLKGAIFKSSRIEDLGFKFSDLEGAVFHSTNLKNVEFIKSDLKDATFSHGTLNNVNFKDAFNFEKENLIKIKSIKKDIEVEE